MSKLTYQKYAALFLGDGRCIGVRRARTRQEKIQILIGEEWTEPGANIARVEIVRRAVLVAQSRRPIECHPAEIPAVVPEGLSTLRTEH
jgi:hypothetical protein